MLVLGFALDEKFVITHQGVEIIGTVVDIRGGHRVRIGLDAPPEVTLDRWEIHQSKQRERARQETGE